MNNVVVKMLFQPPLSDLNIKENMVHVEANTSLLNLLKDYAENNQSLKESLFTEGRISNFINIFHNGQQIHLDSCGDTLINSDSEVCLLCAIRGG